MVSKSSTDIQVKDLNNWKRGQISYFSKSRMQEDALKTAYNVVLDYDGILRPRGSFDESGIPDLPDGLTPLANDFSFKRPTGGEGLLNVFTDGTTAKLYVLKDDLSGWDTFATTFDPALPISIDEIEGQIVIGNGKDKFTYYDVATSTIKRLTKVVDPTTAPTATTSGFSGTNAFDYYYRVSFGGVGGSTLMSPTVKVSSSTLRDNWGSSKSVSIDITPLTIDPNATKWSLWVAQVPTGTGAPTDDEYLKVSDGMDVVQKTFVDNGSVTIVSGKPPVENTTEGIIAKYFRNISGRLWAIGSDNIVYWGGDQGYKLYFGSDNGSDNYDINVGGSVSGTNGYSTNANKVEVPMAVILGRDNSGTTCINLLTRTSAGQGSIWDIYATTNSITSNNQTFSVGTYQFKQREGNDGTDAPFSVLHENNNVYYLSMEGFKSTGVKPNVVGIQSTDIIGSAIRDRILNLSSDNLLNCYAAYYDEAIYWTINYGSIKNNEIWVYDILHGGIWTIWRVPADCVFRWASTNNESPSLYIRQGNKLLRYYKNSRTHSDGDVPFESYIESGEITFGKSNLEWVHILKNVWQFDQALGIINLTVNIHAKNGDIIKSATIPFNAGIIHPPGSGGWDAIIPQASGHSRGAWDNRRWDEVLSLMFQSASPSDKKVDQKVRKNAAYISFKIQADTANTYYELSHLSMLFTYIGVGVEFLSQKGVIKI